MLNNENAEIKVGIVVPTFNRVNNLKLLINSIEKQTYTNYCLVIADDGSDDDTKEYINVISNNAKWKGKLFWVNCGQNVGFRAARSRNMGVAFLPHDCELILFIDSDVILRNDAIEKFVDIHIKYPECFILSRTEWLPPLEHGFINESIDKFEQLAEFIPDGIPQRIEGTFVGHDLRIELSNNPFGLNLKEPVRLCGDWLLLLNIGVPKKIFIELNGFDESFEGYGYEDIDFGIRAEKAGVNCYIEENITAFHIWHKKEDVLRVYAQNQYNLHVLIKKHGITDKFRREVDYKFWWHYIKERNGQLIVHDGEYWTVDESDKYKLKLYSIQWIESMGFKIDEAATVDENSFELYKNKGNTDEECENIIKMR